MHGTAQGPSSTHDSRQSVPRSRRWGEANAGRPPFQAFGARCRLPSVTFPHDANTTPHDGRPTSAPEALSDVTVDGRLGPYRLIREIGHGGMGTVFLGVRDDD